MDARRIDAQGFSTIGIDTGSGPALVLLHAIGLDHRLWSGVVDALSPRFRVVAYDLRGHGGASPTGAVGGIACHAADLAAVLDELGIASAHVAGLSFGGAVAQQFARTWPARLTALTLIATIGEGRKVFDERAAATERDGIAAQIPSTLDRWFNARTLAADAPAVRYARSCLETLSVPDWCANWRSLARFEGLAVAPPVPVHVIAGGSDRSTTPESMKPIADRLAGGRFTVLANAPHLVALEYPQTLAAAIGTAPGEEPGVGPWLAAVRTGTLCDATVARDQGSQIFHNAEIGRSWLFARAGSRRDAETRLSALADACRNAGTAVEISLLGRRLGAYGDLDGPLPYLLPIAMPAPANDLPELDRWYCEEHVGMLLDAPVWRSIERYAVEGAGCDWTRLMLHGVRSEAPLQDPVARRATATPWRDRLAEHPWFTAVPRHVFANGTPAGAPDVPA